ncbi:MAG TPA: DUF6498-containing protein [bacterium]|nr:DUF6498-containing protein [bacterium]
MDTTSSKLGWSQTWHPRHLADVSSLILLAANLVPLLGVFFWNWDLFLLFMLYWMETAIIGFWHILRMAIEAKWFSLFLVPFFCAHFGGFMAVHFLFLVLLFGKDWSPQIHGPGDFFEKVVLGRGLWIPFLALFVSHGVSFFLNYLNPRLSQIPNPAGPAPATPVSLQPLVSSLQSAGKGGDIMMAPYKRVMIMHVTIILGGFISLGLHMDKAAFILLVALKIFVDLGSHARKNFKALPQASPAT